MQATSIHPERRDGGQQPGSAFGANNARLRDRAADVDSDNFCPMLCASIGCARTAVERSASRGRGSDSRYHHGDLRTALLRAGREILEERGPDALTLREAARRAGVSHAAPKNHFPTICHFMAECAAAGFDDFDAALTDAASREADADSALAAMAEAYLRFASDHKAVFRLMFEQDRYGVRTPALREAADRAFRTLVEAVSACDKTLDECELDYRVRSVWAIVHGYASSPLQQNLEAKGALDDVPARAAAQAVRDMVQGARRRCGSQ